MDTFIIAVNDLKEELESKATVFRFDFDKYGKVLSIFDKDYEEGYPFLTFDLTHHQVAFHTHRVTDSNRKIAFIVHNLIKDINYEYLTIARNMNPQEYKGGVL